MPVAGVYALYAKETGHGITFEVDAAKPAVQIESEGEPATAKNGPSNEPGPAPAPAALPAPTEPTKPSGGKPQLRRIK